jgi:uncharacterized protein DUF2630
VDDDIATRVNQLVDEEHRLRTATTGGLKEDDRIRLEALEVQLDQCWDLLRQRRALRAAGDDPSDAVVRPPATVENYRQ